MGIAPSVEDLQAGRNIQVLELNGLTGEPAHIYDPQHSVFHAQRVLRQLWRDACNIAAANKKAGAMPTWLECAAMTAFVWFNPRCSKSRGLKALLEERGIEAEYREYLEQPPSVAELEQLMRQLGTEDALTIMRSKEAPFQEQNLAAANTATRLAAIAATPSLLERPILVIGERAVVARPPERATEIL
ncbi:MAG: ArsC/Spx/MgsR family protein [Planctomycetota bacterium]|jgi:arsenate reductase|nr:ArsC/Spx/MgsR family protein [Planctomycetota bacterium]